MKKKTKKKAARVPASKNIEIDAARIAARARLEEAELAQEVANKAQLTANIVKHKAGLAAMHCRELVGRVTDNHIDYDAEMTRLNRQLHAGAGAVTRKMTQTRKDLLFYYEFARNEEFGQ